MLLNKALQSKQDDDLQIQSVLVSKLIDFRECIITRNKDISILIL